MSYSKSRALNQFSTLDFFCTVSGKVINLRSHWFAVALSACGDKKGTRVRIPDSPAAVISGNASVSWATEALMSALGRRPMTGISPKTCQLHIV